MTRSAQICNDEERSERESEADNLPVDLRSNPHLWSRALGTGRKNEVADSSSGNGNFLHLVAGLSLSDRTLERLYLSVDLGTTWCAPPLR